MWIGLIICVGVTIFSYYSGTNKSTNDPEDEPWGGVAITALIFALALVVEGFRPDFAAELK